MPTFQNRRAIPTLIACAMLAPALIVPGPFAAAAPAPGLAGAVHAHGGAPVAGSPVGLIEQATGTLRASTTTSSSGAFRFDSVRPDRYRLAVGVTGRAFTTATYVATLATAGSPDARVEWTLYPADTPPPPPTVLASESASSTAGVVSQPESAAPLATTAFVAEIPAWVLAAGAAGGAAGVSLGGLCLSGTAICEDAKTTASPQE